MLNIISERMPKTEVYYRRDFQRIGEPEGCGFSFNCDEAGELNRENKAQMENYTYALSHPEQFEDRGRVRYQREYMEPAQGICACGARVVLNNQYLGACECPGCGQWYNLFGQELLPPELWED